MGGGWPDRAPAGTGAGLPEGSAPLDQEQRWNVLIHAVALSELGQRGELEALIEAEKVGPGGGLHSGALQAPSAGRVEGALSENIP